jgi:NIMA (never in mitosis gene a)-related kinase
MDKLKLSALPFGRGVFGEIFRATSKVNKETLCLKKINLNREDLSLEEVQREILPSKIRHPNIVRYNNHFIEGNDFCIVMEYVEGGNLKTKIQKQTIPFNEDFIVHVFHQLVLALLELKSNCIIHRNIKPENIFITQASQIKLGDFGCSKIIIGSQK